MRYKNPDAEDEAAVRFQPIRTVATERIVELANGGFYPAVTVEEECQTDPALPELSADEWSEVRAGTRPEPAKVVFERKSWKCELVESVAPADPAFYVLVFPADHSLFDLDAGKTIGALDRSPVPKPGTVPPPLTIARWLDGQDRTLDGLRGRAVVIDFWGLWCGPCRSSVPQLKALQEKYRNQPVTFISIHTAERDADQLESKVRDFAAEQKWDWVMAIDSGTMTENSVTSHAFGVAGFPTQVVIGRDGKVVYHSSIAPPGLEDVYAKTCDEVTPADEAKIEAYMQRQAAAAGEPWPIDHLSEAEQQSVYDRITLFHLSQQIDAALR
ncbi:MAG: TlpA disulfide reductase family protein [Planctomycetaceae bacterium]